MGQIRLQRGVEQQQQQRVTAHQGGRDGMGSAPSYGAMRGPSGGPVGGGGGGGFRSGPVSFPHSGGMYTGAAMRPNNSVAAMPYLHGGMAPGGMAVGMGGGGGGALGPMRRSVSGGPVGRTGALPPPPLHHVRPMSQQQPMHQQQPPPPPMTMMRRAGSAIEPMSLPMVLSPQSAHPSHRASSLLSPQTAVAATATGLNPQVG